MLLLDSRYIVGDVQGGLFGLFMLCKGVVWGVLVVC